MEQLTLLETLQLVFNQIFTTHLLLFVLGFLVLVVGTFFLNRYKKNRTITILIIASWILFVASIIVMAAPILIKIIEIATQELLKQFYFPNMFVLLMVFLISYVIGIYSFISIKKHRITARINQIIFAFMNLLYVVLVYYVTEHNIDITAGALLYQDKELLAILELIMLIFSLWLLYNLLAKLTVWLNKIISNQLEK